MSERQGKLHCAPTTAPGPTPALHFEPRDLDDMLLEEGIYEAHVENARFHTSESGNTTIRILYRLPKAPPGADCVIEYFVVDGANPTALAISRRRLVALYRACGIEPRRGEEIRPEALVDAVVQIRVGHQTFEGTRRPRVLGYRAVL